MTDYVQKFTGHLTIQAIKHGEVIDEWSEKNTIMQTARSSMAEIISGLNSSDRINKFVLGTEGHDGDLLTPKIYDNTRTQLFSEELSGNHYTINFSNPISGNMGTITEDDNTGTSTVAISQAGTAITYQIDVPVENANYSGTTAFTEAALYVGNNIFSMKTFAGKVKDNSTQLRILWTITF